MKKQSTDITSRLLHRAKFYGRFFQLVPFLHCFILNGSVAEGRARESSDIDILVIAKSGRIFTVRFFVVLLSIMFGIKRSKDETKPHAGKFCFNYFLTDDFLAIPHDRSKALNRYCAENYSRSVLVWGDQELFNRFMKVNEGWWGKYLKSLLPAGGSNFKIKEGSTENHNLHTILLPGREGTIQTPSPGASGEAFDFTQAMSNSRMGWGEGYDCAICRIIRQTGELVLNGRPGDRLERILKRIQIRSIEGDPRTQKYSDLIVYTDRELRFHPPKARV